MDITNILEKNYNVKSNRKQNPICSLEFIKRTYPQIKDIDKTEIRRFCDRLAQMSYFSFNGHCYLVTHGGVPCMPTMKTQTSELIKGVGKYEDAEAIDETFIANTCGEVCTIHGHRNIMKLPMLNSKFLSLKGGCAYNLEGQVEFGGHLRILEITKNDCIETPLRVHFNEIEIINNNFIPEEEPVKEEKSDIELLKEMWKVCGINF